MKRVVSFLAVIALMVASACGGGSQDTPPPAGTNPTPALSSLSPAGLLAGSSAQILTINGTGFLATSSLTLNGATRTPTYVNATQLTLALAASDLAVPGSFPVVVSTPGPGGGASNSLSLVVNAAIGLPTAYLSPHFLDSTYKVNSAFWNKRIKNTIVNWMPHLISQLGNTALAEGGINNFVQAGKKLAGQTPGTRKGLVFSDAYTLNAVESICTALMVDPQGDAEIISAQASMRTTLSDWIPKILSAQERDGYLQTSITLGYADYFTTLSRWTERTAHEGYVGGYFIEAALAHYLMTGRTDTQMYNAAKKLADCWYINIGASPKQAWYDGHEEMEQALTRLGRFVNLEEGGGKGDKYLQLAEYLLSARANGPTDQNDPGYDQSGKAAVEQTKMVGHAVRMIYLANGMANVALFTQDRSYATATDALWDNMVNTKWYVTGGIGSGETSEGFGADYSLPNGAYCESCSGCGTLFFNHTLSLAKKEAKYADLMETTLYNAILGDLDLAAKNYGYTNPLDQNWSRYAWHTCPCCVGNIPRTLFSLPTWMYSRSPESLYVNLFVGSTVRVSGVAGTSVEMVQATDYPLNGNLSITVNPASPAAFKLQIRVPQRDVSSLYTSTPSADGFTSISLNGLAITPAVVKGYAVIDRTWTAGDKVEIVLPMPIQRISAISKVAADQNRVALRRGPLVFNLESVDVKNDINLKFSLDDSAPLTAAMDSALLPEPVLAIKGAFKDGTPLVAIPNYARNNRGGRSIVWMRRPSTTLISPISAAATPSSSFCSSWQSLDALNDQIVPSSSSDSSAGAYGNWSQNAATEEWIQYDFDKAYTVSSTDVYWWRDGQGIALPSLWKLQYWDGSAFVDVAKPSGYPVNLDAWSTCSFTPVTTTKIRVVIEPGTQHTGVLEWKIQ